MPCQDGNATANDELHHAERRELEIKIGDGEFAGTAGYGPNESDVVAEIPCSGRR